MKSITSKELGQGRGKEVTDMEREASTILRIPYNKVVTMTTIACPRCSHSQAKLFRGMNPRGGWEPDVYIAVCLRCSLSPVRWAETEEEALRQLTGRYYDYKNQLEHPGFIPSLT
jgi:hypothetical protein